MQYFKDCKDDKEAKKLFRKLAKEFHPDVGGSTEQMVELQRQYDSFDSNQSSDTKFSGDDPYSRFYRYNASQDYSQSYDGWSSMFAKAQAQYQQTHRQYEQDQEAWRAQFDRPKSRGDYDLEINKLKEEIDYIKRASEYYKSAYQRLTVEHNELLAKKETHDWKAEYELNRLKARFDTQSKKNKNLKTANEKLTKSYDELKHEHETLLRSIKENSYEKQS